MAGFGGTAAPSVSIGALGGAPLTRYASDPLPIGNSGATSGFIGSDDASRALGSAAGAQQAEPLGSSSAGLWTASSSAPWQQQ